MRKFFNDCADAFSGGWNESWDKLTGNNELRARGLKPLGVTSPVVVIPLAAGALTSAMTGSGMALAIATLAVTAVLTIGAPVRTVALVLAHDLKKNQEEKKNPRLQR